MTARGGVLLPRPLSRRDHPACHNSTQRNRPPWALPSNNGPRIGRVGVWGGSSSRCATSQIPLTAGTDKVSDVMHSSFLLLRRWTTQLCSGGGSSGGRRIATLGDLGSSGAPASGHGGGGGHGGHDHAHSDDDDDDEDDRPGDQGEDWYAGGERRYVRLSSAAPAPRVRVAEGLIHILLPASLSSGISVQNPDRAGPAPGGNLVRDLLRRAAEYVFPFLSQYVRMQAEYEAPAEPALRSHPRAPRSPHAVPSSVEDTHLGATRSRVHTSPIPTRRSHVRPPATSATAVLT